MSSTVDSSSRRRRSGCGWSDMGDLDRPDRFVWFLRLRRHGGASHRVAGVLRRAGLGRRTATSRNATMVDFDDVRLLRAITPGSRLRRTAAPAEGRHPLPPAGLVTVTVSVLSAGVDGPLPALVRDLDDALRSAGAPCLALLITEPTPNDYLALPVRGRTTGSSCGSAASTISRPTRTTCGAPPAHRRTPPLSPR